ncbi:hypothetical protein I4U23_011173 [Adineta vaga]|nr:hypothetical protein I4U23_011173 [Adineta vaga]
MFESIQKYYSILTKLEDLLSITNLFGNIGSESGNFLNLYKSDDVEYFLSLFQSTKKRIDPYNIHLSIMACALFIDGLLILTTLIHLFMYGYSYNLLTIWCFIDILILSIFILIFLFIIVLINKLITYDLILHLTTFKMNYGTENEQYSNAVIKHMENGKRKNAVKLLGLVIDHRLAIKVFISVISGLASSAASYIKKE